MFSSHSSFLWQFLDGSHCDDFYLNKNSRSSRSHQVKKRRNRSEQTWFTRSVRFFYAREENAFWYSIHWFAHLQFIRYLIVEQIKFPIVLTKSSRPTGKSLHSVKFPQEDCRKMPRYSFRNHVCHNRIQRTHWLTFLEKKKEEEECSTRTSFK